MMRSLVVLFVVIAACSAQNATVYNTTYFFSGGVPFCTQCGAEGAYACSPLGNNPEVGLWNNGTIPFFFNDIPQSSAVTSITVTVYGSYGCSSTTSTAVIAATLNGQVFDVHSQSSGTACKCNTCGGPIVFQSALNNFGLPLTYFKNLDNNELQLQIFNDVVCINKVEISVTASSAIPKVSVWELTTTPSQSTCGVTCSDDSNCWNTYTSSSYDVTIQDPLPKGSVLLNAAVQIYGTSSSTSGYNISAVLVDTLIGTNLPAWTNQVCSGRLQLDMASIYQNGWPGYAYGDLNTVTLSASASFSRFYYVSTAVVQLYYYQP